MELRFTLEPHHFAEVANLRVRNTFQRKRGKLATALSNAKFNVAGIAIIYAILLATYWIVYSVWDYRVDGYSLLAGFIAAFCSLILLGFAKRFARRRQQQGHAEPGQHCSLHFSEEAIRLSKAGYEQVISSAIAGPITQHQHSLVLWHRYGFVIIPRSAFSDPAQEREFLDRVRKSSGSTLN